MSMNVVDPSSAPLRAPGKPAGFVIGPHSYKRWSLTTNRLATIQEAVEVVFECVKVSRFEEVRFDHTRDGRGQARDTIGRRLTWSGRGNPTCSGKSNAVARPGHRG